MILKKLLFPASLLLHRKNTQNTNKQKMADDPDACLPAPLKDFVFDLHDSARRSMIETEQASLYSGTFRELSSKVRSKFA